MIQVLMAYYRKALMIWLAVMMLMASTSVVAAKGPYFYYPHNGLYEHRSVAPSHWDRHKFHHSGTRGRLGLGADPEHPEGPGNISE